MDVSLNETGVYLFGPFRLDPARRSLTRDGVPMLLTGRLFDLLLCLIQHPDRVVPKDELLGTVWRDRIVEESNLRQAISVLRKTLLWDGQGETLIATVFGRGYRIAMSVRLESAAAPPALVSVVGAPEASAPTGPVPHRHLSRNQLLGGVALAVFFAVAAFWRPAPSTRPTAPVAATSPRRRIPSPFCPSRI